METEDKMTEADDREYRAKMAEVAERFASRTSEAARRGEKEEAIMNLEMALSARRIARGEQP